MKKADYKKFKAGDRVVIKGTLDGQRFTNDVGVILRAETGDILVRFDTWMMGHGPDSREWHFDEASCRSFTITAEPVSALAPPPVKKKFPKGPQAYKGNGKHSWESVTLDDRGGFPTTRLRVPGGWLYRRGGSPVFVPVPQVTGYPI